MCLFFFNSLAYATMDNLNIRSTFKHKFRRGTNAVQTACNIKDVVRDNHFFFLNSDLKSRWPETKVDNDELKAIVGADSFQTTCELVAGFDVSVKTILGYLRMFFL